MKILDEEKIKKIIKDTIGEQFNLELLVRELNFYAIASTSHFDKVIKAEFENLVEKMKSLDFELFSIYANDNNRVNFKFKLVRLY